MEVISRGYILPLANFRSKTGYPMSSLEMRGDELLVSFRHIAPSRLMADTKGLGKNLSDNFESHLHDHLQVIIDETTTEYNGQILPKSFRSEWLMHAKSNEASSAESVDAWFRLIFTFKVTNQIELQNFWFDKLSGTCSANLEIMDYINSNLANLISRCAQEFSRDFKYNHKSSDWLITV